MNFLVPGAFPDHVFQATGSIGVCHLEPFPLDTRRIGENQITMLVTLVLVEPTHGQAEQELEHFGPDSAKDGHSLQELDSRFISQGCFTGAWLMGTERR